MSDLISRHDVLELIDDYNSDGLGSVFCNYDDGEKFKNAILALPSVQKTGKWIATEKGLKVTIYECSECKRHVMDDTGYDVVKDYPYCHCGARMVGKEE